MIKQQQNPSEDLETDTKPKIVESKPERIKPLLKLFEKSGGAFDLIKAAMMAVKLY